MARASQTRPPVRNASNLWSVTLADDEGPCLRGTGDDLMEAIAYLLRWQPGAVFTLAPAQPAFALGRRLDETLARARRLARVWPENVVTLGVHPHGADPNFSYLTLGDEVWGTDGMRRVTAVVERPSLFDARELRSNGAMLGTAIACATVEALHELARVAQPEMMGLFAPVDVARDLLARAPERVLMLPLDGVEWPERQVTKRSASLQVVSTSPGATFDQAKPAISAVG